MGSRRLLQVASMLGLLAAAAAAAAAADGSYQEWGKRLQRCQKRLTKEKLGWAASSFSLNKFMAGDERFILEHFGAQTRNGTFVELPVCDSKTCDTYPSEVLQFCFSWSGLVLEDDDDRYHMMGQEEPPPPRKAILTKLQRLRSALSTLALGASARVGNVSKVKVRGVNKLPAATNPPPASAELGGSLGGVMAAHGLVRASLLLAHKAHPSFVSGADLARFEMVALKLTGETRRNDRWRKLLSAAGFMPTAANGNVRFYTNEPEAAAAAAQALKEEKAVDALPAYSNADLEAEMQRLPKQGGKEGGKGGGKGGGKRLAGLLYLQLGRWPRWTPYLLRAAANNPSVAFYFIGSHRLNSSLPCDNCFWLPLSKELLVERVIAHLPPAAERASLAARLINTSHGRKWLSPRKLCDLKPMWAALFPELAARHLFIGYADSDILLGNLSAEVDRLEDDDELLTPFFPQPLATGNFLLMRSIPKLIRAFERSSIWQQVLVRNSYLAFDEWMGPQPSMFSVLEEMLMQGELVVHRTRRLLIQDTVIMKGMNYPTIDMFNAKSSFHWRGGSLWAAYKGPCVCPNDVVPQFGLTLCNECLAASGTLLRNVQVHHHLEILGIHFQEWKKQWSRASHLVAKDPFKRRGESGGKGGGKGAAVTEWDGCAARNFALKADGFRCARRNDVTKPVLL